MATPSGSAPAHLKTVAQRLSSAPYEFDFFQAVRLMERLLPKRQAVGRKALPSDEVVRFRSHQSVSFPPSAITELAAPDDQYPMPRLSVAFMGMTGPSGALPLHYTQLVLDLHRDVRGPERRALRDWFDLFNHRLISLFYRAWEKYRFFLPYERGEAYLDGDPDMFTVAITGLMGIGSPAFRGRLRVAVPAVDDEGLRSDRVLAKIDDLALIFYSGLFARRTRDAASLTILLNDYFGLPIEVVEFHGQWLALETHQQTRLGSMGTLGVDAIAGSRVWDVQGKIRLRVGPLTYRQFEDFLPDQQPSSKRKSLFLLSHLTRLFIGVELDFDIQLVLKASEVPACRLSSEGLGPQLGWTTWLLSGPKQQDAKDAVFPGEPLVFIRESGKNA